MDSCFRRNDGPKAAGTTLDSCVHRNDGPGRQGQPWIPASAGMTARW